MQTPNRCDRCGARLVFCVRCQTFYCERCENEGVIDVHDPECDGEDPREALDFLDPEDFPGSSW